MLGGCPAPGLPRINASGSGWEIHKGELGASYITNRHERYQRVIVSCSKDTGADHKGCPDLRWCKARTHINSDGNPTKLIKYGKPLTSSTTERRGETERDTERDSCITFGGNQNTESLFQKSIFENWKKKKVFNFLSSHVLCISDYPPTRWASLVAQMVKNLPEIQKTRVWSLDWEDPLEEEMATRSSVLAWRVPQTEESAGYSPWGRKESDTTQWLSRSRRQ